MSDLSDRTRELLDGRPYKVLTLAQAIDLVRMARGEPDQGPRQECESIVEGIGDLLGSKDTLPSERIR